MLLAATGHGPIKYTIHGVDSIQGSSLRQKSSLAQSVRSVRDHNPGTVAADVGHFIHPQSGERVQFVLLVDEGSRFCVSRIAVRGEQKHVSAGQFISSFRKAWVGYFGKPLTLRVDPDGSFRSHRSLNSVTKAISSWTSCLGRVIGRWEFVKKHPISEPQGLF